MKFTKSLIIKYMEKMMNKHIKTFLFVLILINIFNIKVLSQPYIFHLIPNIDSTSFDVPIPFQKIERTNLSTGQNEIILYKGLPALVVDQTQSWFATGTHRYRYEIYSCTDTTIKMIVPYDKQPESIVFSKLKNKLYVISTPNNQDTNFYKFLSVFDVTTKQEESSMVVPYMINIKEEAFFSSDENTLYFSVLDSIYSWNRSDKFNVAYYSTNSNAIVYEKPLSEIGYPNADGYYLHRGRKGKGLIQSFIHNSTKDSYFNVYDFENNIKSNFILNQGFAEPHLIGDGKYIVLLEQGIDSVYKYSYTKGIAKIYDVQTAKLVKTLDFGKRSGICFFENYPNNMYPFALEENDIVKPINIDSLVQLSKGLKVKFVNSIGINLPGGNLQYYEGGWKNAVDNGDGTFIVDTKLKTVSLRMAYEYGTQTKSNVSVGTDTIIFQTVNTLVKLQDGSGNAIDTGKVQYYAGGWRNFGSTSNGVASKELLAANYTFRISYGYASNDKVQNLDTNSTVIFRTLSTSVQLKDSQGNLITIPSTVQYYSGGWRQFGTIINGIANKELLPNNYTFRIGYGFATNDKAQNIGTNPLVEFKTMNAEVQLRDSQNNLIDQGTVQYYSGGWREFGATANGVVNKELLPNNYTFRMSYGFSTNDKPQNIGTNSTVVFQTINANVELRNSLGNLIDVGTVQYYSGGWREFGTTTNGIANKELLPNNYTFRMSYGFAINDKAQNISTNPTVVFQTVNANVELRNSLGNLIDVGTVQYYSGGWREFGITVNGTVSKDLLPNNYTFRITHEFISNDKVQNVGLNNTVSFAKVLCTIRVRNTQSQPVDNASASYYSGGWRPIGITVNGDVSKELLPTNLTFRVNYGGVSQDKTQNLSTNSIVDFIMGQ